MSVVSTSFWHANGTGLLFLKLLVRLPHSKVEERVVQAQPAVSDLVAQEFFVWIGHLCHLQPLLETVQRPRVEQPSLASVRRAAISRSVGRSERVAAIGAKTGSVCRNARGDCSRGHEAI